MSDTGSAPIITKNAEGRLRQPGSVPALAARILVAVLWAATLIFIFTYGVHRRPVASAAALVALGAFAATFALQWFSSVEIACWVAVTCGIAMKGFSLPIVLVWLAVAGLLFAFQRYLLRPPRNSGILLQSLEALQMCLVALLLMENAASWIHTIPEKKITPSDRPTTVPVQYYEGRPTLVTLGSSPANTEIAKDRPFSRVLSERFRGEANFHFFMAGGIDSAGLLKLASEIFDTGQPFDGLILYAGFQDFNQTAIQKRLRRADVIGQSPSAHAAVQWLLANSVLFNFIVDTWMTDKRLPDGENPAEAMMVLEGLKKNVNSLISMVRAHGGRVFIVTLVSDANRVSKVSKGYADKVNEYYRSLAGRDPGVTVVDFSKEFAVRYPNGALKNGEPFEMNPDGSGEHGDPYHLGPVGHEMVADLLEPEIRAWVASWRTKN